MLGMQQKNIYCRASSKKNWDGRRMPPLQEDKKIRQVNPVDLLLSATSVVLPEKLDEINHTMDFHVDIVKKIDTILRGREKKIILEELVSAQQPTLFPEEPFIELRVPLSKKTEAPTFHLGKKQDISHYKQLTMPDEFKTEFFTIHNPSFKFVSTFDTTEDVLRIKKPEERHVEIINLSSLAEESGAVQKKIEDVSESKKDTETMQSKKVEVIKTKKLGDKKCDSATTVQQTEEDTGKAKIYYLNSKNLDEKKIKELEKKQSYIPVDFEDKMQKLKEKEQRELEKQKDAEQQRKEKEQKEREKEEEKLRKLEEQKEKLEAKQRKKEEQKLLFEKREKEAEEKKLLEKEAAYAKEQKEKLEAKQRKKEEQKLLFEKREKEAEEKKLLEQEAAFAKEKKLESAVSKKEEKRLNKLEEKQARLEAKQRKKEEKEAMIKILERDAEERKQLKKKTRRGEYDELKESVLLKSVETKQTPTFVDDDVIKVLLMTDDLLGNLPEDVIDKFAKSEDFKLYEKVISKYKAK